MFTSILNEKICPCNIYMTLAKCVQNLQICPSAILLVQWINDKLIKEDIPINVLPYIFLTLADPWRVSVLLAASLRRPLSAVPVAAARPPAVA